MSKLTKKIGLIVGAGQLPYDLVLNKEKAIAPIYVIGINGVSDEKTLNLCDEKVGLGDIGKIINIFKSHNINEIGIIGYIKRPDFSKISFDFLGIKILPKLVLAAKNGDDAIMRVILNEFENNDLKIMPPEAIFPHITSKNGALGDFCPNQNNFDDIEKAKLILNDLGKYDIGQAIVVIDGCVAAIEAQEGTDEMLKRVANLPKHLIGNEAQKKGILLKIPKTAQDLRIDLPTIGIETIINAIKANLCGIAFVKNKAIIAQEEELIQIANENKMFLFGLDN